MRAVTGPHPPDRFCQNPELGYVTLDGEVRLTSMIILNPLTADFAAAGPTSRAFPKP